MKSRLNHTIRRARRRRALNEALSGGGLGLAFGAAGALGVLIVSRLLGQELPVAVYPALILLGLLIGVARGVVSLPPGFEIARSLDRMMGLRDRLATAYALSIGRSPLPAGGAIGRQPTHDPEFASIVEQEGEHLADRIDVRSLTPVQIGASWWAGLMLVVLVAIGYLYMPAIAWGEQRHDPTVAAIDEEAEEERERLRSSIDEIMEEMREDEIDDPQVQEELDALQRLAEQLAAGTGDPAELRRVRDESAARLNELADRLAEQAQRDREAADRLAERFAGLESPERPMSAQEFDEALKRGDFGEAARAMEEQIQRRDAMTAEERRELAEHLRNTADQVDQVAAEGEPELDEREAQLEQLLRDHGFDDDWMRDLMHGDEEAHREAMRRLEELLADEENAQRMQREIERLREDQEQVEQLQRDLEAVNEAMREAADELDPPTPPDSPDPPDEPTDPTEQLLDEPHEPEEPREHDADTAARDQPDEPERGQPEQREQRDEQPDQQTQREEREEAQREAQEEQREQVAEEQPAQEAQPDEEVAEPGEPDETAQEREAIDEAAPDPDAEQEGAAPSPDETSEQDQQEAMEAAGEDLQEAQEQRRSPSEAMREIEERRRAAERHQQASERARQRARELADSPQRDMQRELERQLQRDPAADQTAGLEGDRPRDSDARPPRDGEVEDVDARAPHDDPGEVIAEWFSDEELDADPEVRRTQIAQRVREAQRVAERAVEEAAVPTRYHEIVRRYFGRLNEE